MPQRVPTDHPLARTFALLDVDLAPRTAAIMRGTTDPTEIEGLVELLLNPEATAAGCLAALRSLEHDTSELVSDTIVRSLHNTFPTIRIAACAEVVRRGLFDLAADAPGQLLRTDPFWQVRKAAVNALAANPSRWSGVLFAKTDPHWRVRYALAQVLVERGRDDAERTKLLEWLPDWNLPCHATRLRDYLLFRWTGQLPPERPSESPTEWCPFWDWDAAVLARNLAQLGREGRQVALDTVARLVTHDDDRVRALVIETLRDDGTTGHWAYAITRCLLDPRRGTVPVIEELTRGITLDFIEAVAKYILATEEIHPLAVQWAITQVDDVFPAADVLSDLERLAPLLKDLGPLFPETMTRPFPSDHPHSRASALTQERARELVENPTLETSWVVLSAAAKMCRVPVWKLAPETEWKPPAEPRELVAPLTLPEITLVRPRQLGPGGPIVSPLGVSGHYGLPVEGFARAAEAGVNLFFWEPNYATLTRFVTRLSPSERQRIHLLAGTFEAEPAKIRKDVERALRNLKLERLGVFLIFWTQSWQRITPDVREVLERLKSEEKLQVFGLSSHSRPLAAEAIRDGWNPVMVRHSAAHRKAETEVFPLAIERGTSILTFNNTCYGRLLDAGQFRPSDCFRFTLNTPGVSACFTAPSTLEYLEENLDALRNPALPDDVRERLLKRGEWMYREDTVFRKTVRADG